MLKYEKIIILLVVIFCVLTVINTVNANENVTIDIGNETPEVDNSTPCMYVTSEDNGYSTFSTDDYEVKVIAKKNKDVYDYSTVINITPKNSSAFKSTPQFDNLQASGYVFKSSKESYIYKSSLLIPKIYNIYKSYSSNTILFKLYFYPNKNATDFIQPDNLYRLTNEGKIYYGNVKIAEGFNFTTKYVKKLYVSHNNTFELETYPYVIQNQGSIYQNKKWIKTIKFNETERLIVNAYSNKGDYYLSNNTSHELNTFVSFDGNYQVGLYKEVEDYKTIKKPIYTYKKVKNGYKWEYYKTKWHKKKIITHKWKNGKWIVYNNKLRKVKKLLNKNGKITKTVYTAKNTIVYLKYPVDYYKKVRKYKYVKKLKGYKYKQKYDGVHYEFLRSENRSLV